MDVRFLDHTDGDFSVVPLDAAFSKMIPESPRSDIARHLRSAQGYFELGMFVEAANEMERISPEDRVHPAVLAYRYAIYSELEKWTHAEEVARHLAKIFPGDPGWWVSWAYSTRRCRSIQEANPILLEAEKLHPQHAIIQFNLGCYACQLGEMEEAKHRVSAAISLDGKFRLKALDDPDLEPLWDEIAKGQQIDDSRAEEK